MIDTILFDLDGTLLPVNTEKFIKLYFYEMGKTFIDIIEPEILQENIMVSTYEMIKNNGEKSNEDVFMNHFSGLVDESIKVYQNKFDSFYDKEFLNTRKCVKDVPIMKKAVGLLKEKGYKMAIVTNPIFPLKAVYHRIRWSGFDPEDFIYVSSYEENKYCKPNIEFYKEVLKDIGKKSEQCLMVGNDVQEDMIVSSINMDTYLITDYIINRTNSNISGTHQGDYNDFYKFVKNQMPSIV